MCVAVISKCIYRIKIELNKMKWILLILLLGIILTGCSTGQKNCDNDNECTYSDDEGSDCVNSKYGEPDLIIYDWPDCICRDNQMLA